jgi:hypothetical protein
VLHRRDWAAPGVPVFGDSWDLGGALKLLYDDPAVGGYPVTSGAPIACNPRVVVVDARRARRVRCAQIPPR